LTLFQGGVWISQKGKQASIAYLEKVVFTNRQKVEFLDLFNRTLVSFHLSLKKKEKVQTKNFQKC
jgi:hypothetical protein